MSVNYFTPTDAHAIMNELVFQATGVKTTAVVDTASFVDAGNSVLESGYENTLKSIGVLIGKTKIAVRPYTGAFKIVSESEDAFDERIRKISYYAKRNEPSGAFNTNLYTNLGMGLDEDDGAGSQWTQNPAIVVEKYFGMKSGAWDKSHTQYIDQLKMAFADETSFTDFLNGIMTEIQNDIESTLEAKNRMVVLDCIAGTYLQAGGNLPSACAVNLTSEFNTAFGTSYTTAQILNEHAVEFLKFFLARFKIDSKKLEHRSINYHDSMEKTIGSDKYYVMRHTPKAYQKFVYYEPIFTQLDFNLANIFNPEMLKLDAGEGVDFWQSDAPGYEGSIDVIPSLPDNAVSSEIKIPLVIGLLFDTDALKTTNKFTSLLVTPVHAKKNYMNYFWHWRFQWFNDVSENRILYFMSDTAKTMIDTFIGDGTEDDFELNQTATAITSVTVDGVEKTATTDYTFADNTVTFTSAPANKAVIVITYT